MKTYQQIRQRDHKKYEHLFIIMMERFIPPCLPLILHQHTQNKIEKVGKGKQGIREKRQSGQPKKFSPKEVKKN
jgi:hypothetical protein